MNKKQIILTAALLSLCALQSAQAATKPEPQSPPWVPLDSEAGMFVFGGGSESGGFAPVGTDGSESGGVGGSDASSESGGPSQSGAESESGGMAETGTSSESGGVAENGASSESGGPGDLQYGIKYYHW